MKLPTKKGFTLIELLIVITILGILVGVLVPIIRVGEYQAQTRDARRVNDLLNLQTALISAMTNNDIELTDTTGCSACDSLSGTIAIDGTGWVKFRNLSGDGLLGFIQNLPKDPKNEGDYKFSYYSDGNRFELNAKLESQRYANYATDDGGNDNTLYERGLKLTIK